MMDTRENITLAMVPDFEFDAIDTATVNAWSALEAMATGMSARSAFIIFGLTQEQMNAYKPSWEQLKKRKAVHSRELVHA